MNSKYLRILVPLAIVAIAAIGYFFHVGFGVLCTWGFNDVSAFCPLGALSTMLASKVFLPRTVISLVLMVVVILVVGKAFCGWMCPVPIVSRARHMFSKRRPREEGDSSQAVEPLTEEERALLGTGCAACISKRGSKVDSRHFVLGGALLSALVFGFPVFCLVCPIGLTFATVFLLINLFSHGDVTWAVVAAPVLLAVEVVFFRKWCHKICPVAALLSLISKGNKTLVPTIDDSKCLESSRGARCGQCGKACPEGIDIRHPRLSSSALNECVKCRACAEACPAHAVSFPLVPRERGFVKPKDVHQALSPTGASEQDES